MSESSPGLPGTNSDLAARVRAFLNGYGAALSSGDLEVVSSCWAVPALVLGDTAAIPVATFDEITGFFQSAVEWYRSRGFLATRPGEISVTRLSSRLLHVTSTWHSYGSDNVPKGSERSFYVLWIDESGAFRIRTTASLG